ncbi:AraC family transcriptional regulator [Pedobacter sp. L105]|uniref:helix-turn-helix domain-containing protein n=1 Tax=Pedobacter sp. L105 TaxID=1641871 RepID=UPI00131ADC53|nr:helix-turn-helix domain-containing protein [Pedobacter sp. L105]
MKYIISAGLLQIVISLLLLFLNSKKEKSDYLLVILLAGIGWHLITKFYIFTEVENPAILFRMHTFIQLSYGPLLYLYAIKKSNEQFLPARFWFLFIPLIISMTLYGCVVTAFLTYPDRADFVLQIYNSIVFLPIIGTHFVFGILTIRKIKHVEHVEGQLIRYISVLLIMVGLVEILLMITKSSFPLYNLLVRSILYTLLGLVPILVIRFKYVAMPGDWQTDRLNLSFETNGHREETEPERLFSKNIVGNTSNQVQRKLLLDSDQHQEIYRVIESLVKDKKMYREEDLSLEKLAALSGFSRHYISETLNVFAQRSFYQYINNYRIQEVIRLLNDNENSSILSVAYNSGFKNKASFNQYFKKITGSTPSAYLKKETVKS